MKKIERPDWCEVLARCNPDTADISFLNQWFNEVIQPINKLLDSAVEVYAPSREGKWDTNQITITCQPDSHRAWLIDIERINNESCADVLKDMLNDISIEVGAQERMQKILDRAKAALARSEGES